MVVTKADVYEKVISAERPVCPHCGKEMKILECNDTGLSCSSRWGTPYLFVCLNDECQPFVNGWENMKRDYGRKCSYRCICYPDSRKTEMMMVFSYADCKSGVIDEGIVAADRAKGTPEDPAVQEVFRCFESNDVNALLANLFDDKVHYKVRLKAVELIVELGLLEAVEPLQNHQFVDQRIAIRVHDAVARIHKISNTRECPYCTEIIEAGATICSQCGRDLS
jgi:RNA polymerase subunit RPABC4/transcription elongation factor Spt4